MSIWSDFRQATSALFSRWGGSGFSYTRLLLPGSRLDYQTQAGDLWSNSIVALGVKWLGDRFPRPILQVSAISKRGDYVPLPSHPMLDLWQHPNPYYNRRTMEKAIGLSLVCDGNAYVQKVRDQAGKVKELWWIPHDRVAPMWPDDGSEFISGYMVRVDTTNYPLTKEDVLHIRDGIDPRNERLGLSTLKSQLREVCTVNEESGYTASLLHNSAVPGLVITPDDPALRPNADDAQRIKERIREAFTGDSRGDTAVLAGKYKIQPLGFSPEQLRLDRLPAPAIARIASAVGVAPMSMGLPDTGKTYSNLAEANRTSWGTIISMQELIAESLRYDLLLEFGSDPVRYTVEYDYSQIQELQESLDALHARTREDWKSGVIQLNEARELLGFDPDPGGDRWFPGTESGPADTTPGVPQAIPQAGAQAIPSSNGKGLISLGFDRS